MDDFQNVVFDARNGEDLRVVDPDVVHNVPFGWQGGVDELEHACEALEESCRKG